MCTCESLCTQRVRACEASYEKVYSRTGTHGGLITVVLEIKDNVVTPALTDLQVVIKHVEQHALQRSEIVVETTYRSTTPGW